MEDKQIVIKGARINNLKNIDVAIPRDRIVVITGLSGSGKSSLAFDTLYAEGQRRYVESLSSYARQFLGRMSKPECDYIKGIPPAIAIEQKVNTRNPRSTVGTSTEIYDYLRLLYARIGKTISPVSGTEVKCHTVNDLVEDTAQYDPETRLAIYAPVIPLEGRSIKEQLEVKAKEGYSRVEVARELYAIGDALTHLEEESLQRNGSSAILLLIDRTTCSRAKDNISRLRDSGETAFFEGRGSCVVRIYTSEEVIEKKYTNRFETDGILFEEPTEQTFNFNNPVGACPTCEGFGKVIGIDEDLVIPNKTLSVYEGAVACWKGEKMGEWLNEFIHQSSKYQFPVHRPYYQLNNKERDLLWHGAEGLHGIDDFFHMLEENQYKVQYRVMMARYRGKTTCPSCKGARLKPSALYVKIGGCSIAELVVMSVSDLKLFFDSLVLDEQDESIAKRILLEISNRILFLQEVGLGYLTLDRLSASLSGGESQRINLASSLGSSLVGSLYILDEPSIGLHPRDTALLIKVLRRLQELGNTVVVVEHDEEIIRASDYIIDIGPNAGRLGGEVVYQGDMSNLDPMSESHTVRYLTHKEEIAIPARRRKWNNFIEVIGAAQHNLKNINVKFPLNVMTVVTGVSGSGKSSLVRDVFYYSMKRYLGDGTETLGVFRELKGDMHLIKAVEFVDQNPIGRSSRSNPVTYTKAFDEIRRLFAEQPLAKQMGFGAGYFSFNTEGGRCEECKGDGVITVPMQFMADITLTCESCDGKRFNADVLEVEYKGKNIYDVLEMTVNQAIEFFTDSKETGAKRIVRKLLPLQQVGLGYVKLGQSSSTLSGGENQRVKLALFLGGEKNDPTLFVFDEPTTGLHFHDINTLLTAFNALIDRGHTIVIIEHNTEVIKCADYIIDLGPEGGKAGGNLVCAGTPEQLTQCKDSYTGKHLQELFNRVKER